MGHLGPSRRGKEAGRLSPKETSGDRSISSIIKVMCNILSLFLAAAVLRPCVSRKWAVGSI